MARRIDSVRSVNGLKTSWTIMVRVVRLWIRPPAATSKVKEPSIDMILCDHENTTIGASVKPSFYKKFKNIVKEGIIYEISQFTVGNNGESFRSTDHEFKINFQYSTSVFRRNPPQPIPMYGFHFKELSQVTSRDFDMKNLFDVLGKISGISPFVVDSSGDKSKNRVTMEIEDREKSLASITLWGRYVEQVCEYMSTFTEGAIVVAIQWCRTKEYRGQITLTNSMYATRVFINADIPEIKDFHEGLDATDRTPPAELPKDGSVNTVGNGGVDPFMEMPGRFITDLYHAPDKSVVCLVASVMYVNSDKGWYYESCKKCSRKVDPDGNIFYCKECNMLVPVPVSKYKIEITVIDDTGSANFTVFDRDVSKFLGLSVAQLRKVHAEVCTADDVKTTMPEAFDRFLGNKFVFRVNVNAPNQFYAPSFAVSKMSCDDALVERWNSNVVDDKYQKISCSVEDDKISGDISDDLTMYTPDQNTRNRVNNLRGQTLSFSDTSSSPEVGLSSCNKRSSSDGTSTACESGSEEINKQKEIAWGKRIKQEK